jgi:HlyD family secretion protein
MKKHIYVWLLILNFSCEKKVETISPKIENITESVYSSGIIKSENQYQVISTTSGVLQQIYISENDTVKKGEHLFRVYNEIASLNRENAQLQADFNNTSNNEYKLRDLNNLVELAKAKLYNDSVQFIRQKSLWEQNIGTKVEFEQKELAFKNSKANFKSAITRLSDLKKQIDLNAKQSVNNLKASKLTESDFVIKSEINGKVYSILKNRGEVINSQIPLAIIGDANNFLLELQVDEFDIVKIKIGQKVFVRMDSYKNEVFDALVTKINPIMNEKTKTFIVEAKFLKIPDVIFPNLSAEANILIQQKSNVLTIPRNFIVDEEFVIKKNNEKVKVKLGLKDYQKAEVLEGLLATDEILKP